jgi:serine/threonine protein phosphatase PrpC
VTRYVLRTDRGELRLQVAQASHVGMVRAVNEDSLLAEPPVFAVADGMGGHSFGDRASATAVLALHEEFDPGQVTDPDHVFAAIRRANAAVRELTAWAGGGTHLIAGTTLAGVALVVEHPEADPRWMVFNLGDSRVYRVRGHAGGIVAGLERITVDHSLVQELLDAGLIDDDEARRHPERNVITRALGAADEVRAEAWMLPATEPQTFLLCSDGLTKELDDARIAELLAALDPADPVPESPDAAVDRLLAAALAAGGADNVSIVVLSAEYHLAASELWEPDEQTRERGLSALSPELDDTRPRV